jgi:hypothetical protein
LVIFATVFDHAFLLIQCVVVVFFTILVFVSLFLTILIVSIGESEHRADDTEREIRCGEGAGSIRINQNERQK